MLQVGKGQVAAQPALGRLEVDGILVRGALEAFTVGLRSHLHRSPILWLANCHFSNPYGQNSRRARCPTHELLNFTSIAGS